jgi:hypothetical protein
LEGGAVVSSPTRSLLRRTSGSIAAGLAMAFLLFPPVSGARPYLPADDSPPIVTYSIDGIQGTNNWYRGSSGGDYIVVHWSVSDPESQITQTIGCEPAIQIPGPNTGTTRTCSATSDGGTTTVTTKTLKIDAEPPTTMAAPNPSPNGAGWFNAPLSVSWTGNDDTSGIAACSLSVTYNGPDTTGTTKTGSCTDKAGNSSSDSYTIKYDATSPQTSPAPNPAPNGNGWLKTPLTLGWTGNDPTPGSGIASCSPSVSYSGPDTTGTTRTGNCTDVAGNTSSNSFVIRYDTHAPTTDATPSPSPNAAGWHKAALTVSWTGNDPAPASGIDFCSSTVSYNGPDTTGTTKTGSCTDKAGNSSSDSYTIKYDATPPQLSNPTPQRQPDHDGWYNHSLPIDWHGSDLTSGLASCASKTYSSPDSANASMSGSCTDVAGNVATNSIQFAYDATDPVVSVTAARDPDHDGWYNQPVRISWSGTDATSGIGSGACTPPVIYSGPDSSNASSGGGCTDRAGNSSSPPPLAFKYDATAPVTQAIPSRRPDANGWYNRPLRVDWKGFDPVSGVGSCSSFAYSGPDAASLGRTGVCSDKAGNTSAPVAFDFRYDHTPPSGLVVAAARPPDHDGWYKQPVAIRWSALDTLAGIASCTSVTYSGPDTTSRDLTGVCTDRAGNVAGPLRFALSYDATPPAFKGLFFKAMNDLVTLRWRLAGATALQIMRSPGVSKSAASALYEGSGSRFTDRRVENYVKYRYTLIAEDAAGNTVKRSVFAKPMPVLFAPRPEAHVRPHSSVLFAWKPAPRARYFNLQLWLKGHPIGTWWPARPWMRLSSRWRFRGATHRLEPGTYTWYVWPGRGPRRLGKYGPLLGKSTFVVG